MSSCTKSLYYSHSAIYCHENKVPCRCLPPAAEDGEDESLPFCLHLMKLFKVRLCGHISESRLNLETHMVLYACSCSSQSTTPPPKTKVARTYGPRSARTGGIQRRRDYQLLDPKNRQSNGWSSYCLSDIFTIRLGEFVIIILFSRNRFKKLELYAPNCLPELPSTVKICTLETFVDILQIL